MIDGPNLYVYAMGSPSGRSDPSGKQSEEETNQTSSVIEENRSGGCIYGKSEERSGLEEASQEIAADEAAPLKDSQEAPIRIVKPGMDYAEHLEIIRELHRCFVPPAQQTSFPITDWSDPSHGGMPLRWGESPSAEFYDGSYGSYEIAVWYVAFWMYDKSELSTALLDQCITGFGGTYRISSDVLTELSMEPDPGYTVRYADFKLGNNPTLRETLSDRARGSASPPDFIWSGPAIVNDGLGGARAHVSGTLYSFGDGRYEFAGEGSFTDIWDFDLPADQSHRTSAGASRTKIGHDRLPGVEFRVETELFPIEILRDGMLVSPVRDHEERPHRNAGAQSSAVIRS